MRLRRLFLLSFIALSGLAIPATASASQPSPLGAHSMLFFNTPPGAIDYMFSQAHAQGASSIRLDLNVGSVFPLGGSPDWTYVNHLMDDSRRYSLQVLIVLDVPPWYIADCAPGTSLQDALGCPVITTTHVNMWELYVTAIAQHTRGVINDFEIINEPDGRWAYNGSPQNYAAQLCAAYKGIHAANPAAQVALGGLMNPGANWVSQVFATPGLNSAHCFDVANVHIRWPVNQIRGISLQMHALFSFFGFNGPLWVTESGYPADPAYQHYSGYSNGQSSQAAYDVAAVKAFVGAGVQKVFVTERDMDPGSGSFASEGTIQCPYAIPDNAAAVCHPRQAFGALRSLAAELNRPRVNVNIQYDNTKTMSVFGATSENSVKLTVQRYKNRKWVSQPARQTSVSNGTYQIQMGRPGAHSRIRASVSYPLARAAGGRGGGGSGTLDSAWENLK